MGVPRSYERSTYANNWVRGNGHPFSPPTPPYVRVRIRRFRKLSPVGLVRIAARRGASPLGWVSVPASLFLYSASSAVADWQAHGHHEIRVLLPTLTVRAFIPYGTTMPSADFCRWIRRNYSLLSHHFVTNNRSPEVSSTAFRTQPPDLPPVPLMDMDFGVSGQLVRHRRPHHPVLVHRLVRLLHASFRPASRRRPCASLSLHLHQVVKRTFTFKLSNMLGTQQKGAASLVRPFRPRF
jgi:hypothetical protein